MFTKTLVTNIFSLSHGRRGCSRCVCPARSLASRGSVKLVGGESVITTLKWPREKKCYGNNYGYKCWNNGNNTYNYPMIESVGTILKHWSAMVTTMVITLRTIPTVTILMVITIRWLQLSLRPCLVSSWPTGTRVAVVKNLAQHMVRWQRHSQRVLIKDRRNQLGE